jgi:anti-sigma regulatory factor (Ser/Thr protein kinase)
MAPWEEILGHVSERPPTGFQKDITAVPSILPAIRRDLDRLLDGELVQMQRVWDIRLAVTEACANAVLHAYSAGEPGTVHVAAEVSADTLVVAVRDYGRGIPDSHSGQGVGMGLMRSLADTLEVHDVDPGVLVRMRFLF